MKLRIFDSTVRFRMRRPELANWLASGQQAEAVQIGPAPGDRWSYRLITTHGPEWNVTSESGQLVVTIPMTIARNWADSDAVSLEHLTPWGTRIIIEKDLPRRNERSDS